MDALRLWAQTKSSAYTEHPWTGWIVRLVLMLFCFVSGSLGGCSDDRSASLATAVCWQDAIPSGLRAMYFEHATDYRIVQGSARIVGTSSERTQGSYSLGVSVPSYSVLETVAMPAPPEVTATISLDVRQPTRPANHWLGAVQMYFDVPSANAYNFFVSQSELTGMPENAWTTLRFTVSAEAQAIIRRARSDLKFRIAINPPSGTSEVYRLDHLRFQKTCQDTDGGTDATSDTRDATSDADARLDTGDVALDADVRSDAADTSEADVRPDAADADALTDVSEAGDVGDSRDTAVDADVGETIPRCGNAIVEGAEDCDDGLGDGGVQGRRSCNANCQAVVIPVIVPPVGDASLTVAPWRLGQGRHPLASNESGFALALQESDGPSVAITTITRWGRPSDVLRVVSQGARVAVEANPVVAAAPSGGWAVAFNALRGDGDHLGVALRLVAADGSVQDRGFANTRTDGSQFDPDIIYAGNRFIVAWVDTSHPTSGRDVRWRAFSDDLRPIGDERELAVTDAIEDGVSLEVVTGGWLAAWRSVQGPQEVVHVHHSGGTRWSIGPHRPGPLGDKPALAVESGRMAVATSVSVESTTGEMLTALRGAELTSGGGTLAGNELLGVGNEPHSPSVSGGSLIAVYRDEGDWFESFRLANMMEQVVSGTKVVLRAHTDHARPVLTTWLGQRSHGLLVAETYGERVSIDLRPINLQRQLP